MSSHAKAPSVGSIWTAAVTALALALAFLVLSAAPALAAVGHPVLRTFSTGPNTGPHAVDTDSDGNVYVIDVNGQRLDKFDAAGNRAPFSGTAPYIADTALTGTSQGPFNIATWAQIGIAVDRSGGPTEGDIYIGRFAEGGPGDFFAFGSSGDYKGRVGSLEGFVCGAGVNQATGEIYQGSFELLRRFPRPTPPLSSLSPNGALGPSCVFAIDAAGTAYVSDGNTVSKYDASQFEAASPTPSVVMGPVGATALAVDQASGNVFANNGSEVSERNPAGVQQGVPFAGLSNSSGVAVDADGNVLATDSGGGVFVFDHAQVALPTATTGGSTGVTTKSATVEGAVDPDGAGTITSCEIRYGEDSGYSDGSVPCAPGGPIASPTAVSANLTGLVGGTTYRYRVFVTNANGTQMASGDQTFTTASAIEGMTTGQATDVKKDSAVLHGSFTGDGQDTHYYFEWGRTTAYGRTTPVPPGADAGTGSGTQEVAPIQISGLMATTLYHYRLVASNAAGIARGQDETLTTAEAVTNLTADAPTQVTDISASLNASFDGDGTYDTRYYFEWGTTTAYGNLVPVPPGNLVPAGNGRLKAAPMAISGLQSGAAYHYRVVATNATGKTVSADASFQAAEAPVVGTLGSREVTATSAVLTGEVNPRFGQTSYRFEWGLSTAYGNSIPVPDGDVGAGTSLIPVSAQLEGLTSGVTYHFRLVATNQYGTTRSVDQTFGFYPPPCPNAQVRQETGSNDLPDCRAYEMVTPPELGGTTIYPLNSPSSGYATNPPRIGYGGNFGMLPGTGNPLNSVADLYVATRTDTGWFTKYVGPPSNEKFFVGRPPEGTIGGVAQQQSPATSQYGVQTTPSLDRFIDYDLGQPSPGIGQVGRPSNAPYVWDAYGNPQGRWPTNLASIPGGEDFVGTVKASADLSHFVFSSNVAFAPGGEEFPNKIECCGAAQIQVPMCCSAPIYDNNVLTGEVSLISIKEDGTPFRGAPVKVSSDGTRILMSETADTFAGVNRPLFMRVGSQTYDIAPGHSVHYVDSTDDGKTVYLTSAEQLTGDDHDNSADLFAWKESEPNSLTRISFGTGGAGNSDNCPNSWIDGCGVKVTTFTQFYGPGGNGQERGNSLSDRPMAGKSGDIYFQSPEQLIPGQGETGEANIYLYRGGQVRFVVTTNTAPVCSSTPFGDTICSDGPIARMQVTPDGSHMAFVTGGRLTAYDNAGFGEMYTYSPSTGRIACASCRLDGQPPESITYGSQNGLFLTEDGRTFFSTSDPLVARDTNATNDVYEYVEGKAQLISSGLGSGIPGGYSGNAGQNNAAGLIGVSANGTDVYFGTLENLVTQDHNGRELKIYDARTGGGFPAERVRPNCAAADECHGPGNAQPSSPPDRTSANLGKPAKKAHAKKHKKKAKKKAKAKKKKSKAKHNARNKGTNGRNHRG